MTNSALRTRWETGQGRRTVAAIMAALLSGHRPVEVGFPNLDRRVDLRGIVVPEPEALRHWAGMGMGRVLERVGESLNLGAIRLSWVHLGDSYLPHLRLASAVVADCRFDQATLPDLRSTETRFERCAFNGADLGDAVFGPGTRFVGCDFSGARLRKVSADCAAFSGCEFGDATIADCDFNHTVFDRCHFAGALSDVRFRAESMAVDPALGRTARPDPDCLRDCDLGAARLEEVSFDQLLLKRVRLPSAGAQLLLPDLRCVLLAVRQDAASAGGRIGAQRLATRAEHELRWLPRGRDWGHLNLDDIRRGLPAAEGEFAVEMVERALATCAERPPGLLGRLFGRHPA
ncbi:MAG TPA: pentapeptide repeat-containing protein [Candidatus Dormibacteraeota bacterium]|nr:pentapeptide repeat-containing protein [Candidatus Dormibacteraeota bacterium]